MGTMMKRYGPPGERRAGTGESARAPRERRREGSPPRVLIVEDDPHLRLLYELELRRQGFATLTARDGEHCLQELPAADIDLILLDARLPGVSGAELVERIRNRCGRVPIIVNTAYARRGDGRPDWEVEAFLIKSADPTELIDTACRLTGRRAR